MVFSQIVQISFGPLIASPTKSQPASVKVLCGGDFGLLFLVDRRVNFLLGFYYIGLAGITKVPILDFLAIYSNSVSSCAIGS